MRLIDADKCPCNDCVLPLGDSRGCSIFPCREFGEWYKNTAYDVDKVVEKIQEVTYCDLDEEDYDNGYCVIDMDAVLDIVKRGGVDWVI